MSETQIPENILEHILHGHNTLVHGKAGTGKSTILRALTDRFPGSVVLSPTGIAAMNVGGVTVHSFFGFGLGFIFPEEVAPATKQGQLLSCRPLLIIDEVSMVRADLFDAIDISCQKTLKSPLPFGGLQVILLGDTGQLPPVVPYEEKNFFLEGPMFFNSRTWDTAGFHHVELTHVYRQTDMEFIDFLSRVRGNTIGTKSLEAFNNRVRICEDADQDPDTVVLCLTNRAADSINQAHYGRLTTPEFVYPARITGSIQHKDHPTAEILKLKIGTKVLMIRNDQKHRWVNGTAAEISRLEKDRVFVRIKDREYEVERETWEKFKYEPTLNAEGVSTGTRKVVSGSFEQFPVKLAWGITVHKSQGMTLAKFHLDLSTPIFEHGQLYVALSRARSVEGISMSRRLQARDIKVNRKFLLADAPFEDF